MLVIINGSPMEQGLRWGDLLSTFLFVLGANVLNRLMNNAVLEGLVKGISIGRQCVNFSNLQFIDDIILFAPAKKEVLLNMRRILD